MKRVLLDTNIYSAFKRNNSDVVDVLRYPEYIGISATVIGELHAGFNFGGRLKKNIAELERFLDTPRVHFLGVDEITAEFYGLVYQQLRRKGTPIPSNDIWIAASAIQHGLALMTLDSHFAEIDGLILFDI